MPVQLPYLSSYKNVPMLFEKIASAKVPDSFTHAFLQNTIGLKGTGDRPLIPFLRSLGFIDQSGKPLPEYSKLKGSEEQRRVAIGHGVSCCSDIAAGYNATTQSFVNETEAGCRVASTTTRSAALVFAAESTHSAAPLLAA
jgi:Family of unknown function (DUF5343)